MTAGEDISLLQPTIETVYLDERLAVNFTFPLYAVDLD